MTAPRSLALALVLVNVLWAPAVLATSHTSGPTTTADVNNIAPVVGTVTVNGGVAIDPTAGSTTAVTIDISASDDNGFADITSVVWAFRDPAVANYANGTLTIADDCTGSGATLTCAVTFQLNYDADPGTYTTLITVTDAGAASDDNSDALVSSTVTELIAIELSPTSISFGALDPGAASTIKTMAVLNRGNVALDIDVSGTQLSHATLAATVPVGQIQYSLASDLTSPSTLTGTPTTITAFDLAYGAGNSKDTYWKLTMPTGADRYIPPGVYSGTITVAALADA